jgi:hypothetical protein
VAESGSSAGRSLLRNLLGAVQVILVVAMLALLVRLVFEFFGALQAGQLWIELKRYTDIITLPIAVKSYRAAQYGGWFNVRVVLSLVIYLVAEYVVTAIRRRI